MKKYNFRGENFHGLLAFATPIDATSLNFTETTFTNSHKTVKFESFPVYSKWSKTILFSPHQVLQDEQQCLK